MQSQPGPLWRIDTNKLDDSRKDTLDPQEKVIPQKARKLKVFGFLSVAIVGGPRDPWVTMAIVVFNTLRSIYPQWWTVIRRLILPKLRHKTCPRALLTAFVWRFVFVITGLYSSIRKGLNRPMNYVRIAVIYDQSLGRALTLRPDTLSSLRLQPTVTGQCKHTCMMYTTF